jgi:hypothetical protein
MIKYTQTLQHSFNVVATELSTEGLDIECALIDSNGSFTYFKDDWDLADFLHASNDTFVYVPYPYNKNKVKELSGGIKKTTESLLSNSICLQ